MNPGRKWPKRLPGAAELISEHMKGATAADKYAPNFTMFAPPRSVSHYFHFRCKRAKSSPTLIELWGFLRELYWSETGHVPESQLIMECESFGSIDSEAEEVDEVDASEEEQTAVASAEEYWDQVD
jgi:hypothetical protein